MYKRLRMVFSRPYYGRAYATVSVLRPICRL